MNTRALAILATISLSALAGCSTAGTTPTNYAALHGNGAVMSDAGANPNAIPSGRSDFVNAPDGVTTGVWGPDYNPDSHRFQGGWWKDH